VRPATSPTSDDALLLALDQGTTNTKAILVAPSTREVVSAASRPVSITYPAAGWVEQDAHQLWDATRAAVETCLAADGRLPAGIAISNQRESVVAWSRTSGEPLGPVLGWQDARTADWCAAASQAPGVADLVRDRTGLSLEPAYSASKLRWLVDAARAGGADPSDILVGTIDTWLVWQLTGTHVIEAGNASRTLLLDLRTLSWDPELLDLFGIPEVVLPEVRASDAGFGRTVGGQGIPAGIPVIAILADSHAALFHHASADPGSGKATYGTGTSVMVPCAGPAAGPTGVATTLAWLQGDEATYAREGNILASGAALDWMARTLGAPDGTPGGSFLTELGMSVPDSGGVVFVPAFSGLGSPLWDRRASGVITGLTAGTTRAHLARAALEGIAHQVVDVVEAIESDGLARFSVLNADGGASASRPLMQLQADLLERPVHVAAEPEASAWGAALLAAQALGMSIGHPTASTLLEPQRIHTRDRRDAWRVAVARARGHAIPGDAPYQPRPHPTAVPNGDEKR
jgi:glycerol kinase